MLSGLPDLKAMVCQNVAGTPATAKATAPYRLNIKLTVIARAPDCVRYDTMRGRVLQNVIARRDHTDTFGVIIQANMGRFITSGVKQLAALDRCEKTG